MYEVCFNIEWDIDEHFTPDELGIPRQIIVIASNIKDAYAIANSDISDSISDEYGFCINSIIPEIIKLYA